MNLTELWKSGTPLSDAWREFGPSNLVEELEKIEAIGFDFPIKEHMPPLEAITATLETINHWTQHRQKAMETKRQMQEELLDALYEKRLFAVGITKSKDKDEIELIDSNLFDDAHADWMNCTLTCFGRHFRDVTVMTLDLEPIIQRNSQLKIGRPSERHDIEAAISILMSRDNEFCTLPRDTSAELVRNYLREEHKDKYQDDKNIGEKTIKRYVLEACRRLSSKA